MRELEATLQRPKFQPQLRKRDHTAESLLAIAASLSQFVSITACEFDDLCDPADAKIIATAIAAQAQALITGDRDYSFYRRSKVSQCLHLLSFCPSSD